MWIPSHFDIKGNEFPDQLAKNKLDKPNYMHLKYSITELNSKINAVINQKWHTDWDINKQGRILYNIIKEVSRVIKPPRCTGYEQSKINRIILGKPNWQTALENT